MMNNDNDRLSILPNLYTSKTGDDTTVLDSSTVPTYEEFTRKKINKNLFNKIRFNSTQYYDPSSIITDDESEEEEDEEEDLDNIKPLAAAPPSQPRQYPHNRQALDPDKICTTLEKIQIQSHSPNINLDRFRLPQTPVLSKTPSSQKVQKSDSLEDEYVQLEHKQVQTSFTSYENTVNVSDSKQQTTLELHLSNSAVHDDNDDVSNNSGVDIISETIIESPPARPFSSIDNLSTIRSNLLATPLRLTAESTSICPKSFIRAPNDDNSPKLIRLSKIASPPPPPQNIITTYEKHRFEEKSVIIINHQMGDEDTKKRNKKRVSMCAEDLPQEIVEHNLDDDENRLDVTRGNIVTLESINERDDKENYYEEESSIEITKELQKPKKFVSKVSSDSESNDEAYERFLQQHRANKQQAESQQVEKRPIKGFVVDDNYVSSASTTDSNVATSSSDEHVFYIKTTQKMISKQRVVGEKPSFTNARTANKLVLSTTSSSSSEIDEDDDEEEEEEEAFTSEDASSPSPIRGRQRADGGTPTIIRRKNSESALETVFRTPQPKASSTKLHFRTEVKKMPSTKSNKFGFIESLSACLPDDQRHPEAIDYCKKFTNKKIKDELLRKVFVLFNQAVFDGKLPLEMKLLWNNRLTSTAGMCKYKTENGKPTAEIHISTKVCDTAERLRDTCVHEMCHAAVFLFHGSKNEGHGRLWQYWAHKVTEAFKNIPKVSTSHNYTINKKFVYKCVDCGQEIQRFQKSIDLEKNVCGRCHGRFVLLYNDKKQQEKQKNLINDKFIFGATTSVTAEIELMQQQQQQQTPRRLNTFAQFVKDNYSSVKAENKLSTHKDVMQEISKKFKSLSTK